MKIENIKGYFVKQPEGISAIYFIVNIIYHFPEKEPFLFWLNEYQKNVFFLVKQEDMGGRIHITPYKYIAG